MIHATAIIHPNAKLAPDVEVGPYAIIDGEVEVGPECRVGPHVYLTGATRIGRGNRFHAGCVIGDAPQDLKYKGESTPLRIGDNNTFREHVTVHRSSKPEGETVIGSGTYLMASAHVGHNCTVGDGVIIANSAMLGGHVAVGDKAFISATCLVHQFTRVGTLVMMQGGSGVSKDVPPFTVVTGVNHICGLNIVGLRRSGITPQERFELKQVYALLFRSALGFRPAIEAARSQFTRPPSLVMIDFIAQSARGVCPDVRPRLAPDQDEGSDLET